MSYKSILYILKYAEKCTDISAALKAVMSSAHTSVATVYILE